MYGSKTDDELLTSVILPVVVRCLARLTLLLALAALTTACTSGDCPDSLTRGDLATSCPVTVVFDEGTYIVTGSCVERASVGEAVGTTTSPNEQRVFALNGVPPSDAVALIDQQRICRMTWAYYHRLVPQRLAEIDRTIATRPPPDCRSTIEEPGYACETPV